MLHTVMKKSVVDRVKSVVDRVKSVIDRVSKVRKQLLTTSAHNMSVTSEADKDVDLYGFPRIPHRGHYTREKCDQRRNWAEQFIGTSLPSLEGWWGPHMTTEPDVLNGNIEAPIGLVRVPLGIAGPLNFYGTYAKGLILAPMATTEGALVASTTRGCTAINASGGVRTHAGQQRMTRAPIFLTDSPEQASFLSAWLSNYYLIQQLQEEVISKTSGSAKLMSILPITDIKAVHALFIYSTGDAAGQNMVTTTTWNALHWLANKIKTELPDCKISLRKYWIEGMMTGDKRSTTANLLLGRGTNASAIAEIPESVLKNVLKIDIDLMLEFWSHFRRMTERTGAHGSNVNVSNILASIFTATGQDIACVHESSLAQLSLTRCQIGCEDGIQAEVNFPSLVVGTVGGGTALPTQADCLKMMKCYGVGKSSQLAEVIAGYALALDLSTLAALASGQFATAHERLGRNRPNTGLLPRHINDSFLQEMLSPSLKLKSWKPLDIDASTSILSDITKSQRSMKKLIGHFGFEIDCSDEENRSNLMLIVLKSKATDGEVINALNKIAQACGGAVASSYDKFKEKTGFKNVHNREVKVYSLAKRSVPFKEITPVVYFTHKDEANEQYLIATEYLIEDKFSHLNTIDDITAWDDEAIKQVLCDMAHFHSYYFNKPEMLQSDLGDVLEEYNTSSRVEELKPLFHDLVQYNSMEFPKMWTPNRVATVNKVLQNIPLIWDSMEQYPKTLVHNDFNPRNLCLRKGQPELHISPKLCLYDWELCAVNIPQRDLAEFLLFTLPSNKVSEIKRYMSFYSEVLQEECLNDGVEGDAFVGDMFSQMFDYCVMDMVVNRLALYTMVHTFKDYRFLDRVVSNAFDYLDLVSDRHPNIIK